VRAEVDLKPYDWSNMPLGYSWYIFGGSGKGKTILMENILYYNARRFHSGFIQTPTQDVIEKFARHIPLAYINPKHSV
jgi:ABC-type transporter Mla maintaining outer membrane lipid asymmetry ATPase subunit MlaF